MDKTNEQLRKELNILVEKAYEAEMTQAVKDLEKVFGKWQSGHISVFELNEAIHRYHQGPAREIYNRYSVKSMSDLMVAQAIANGLLKEETLSAEMKNLLAAKINLYKQK